MARKYGKKTQEKMEEVMHEYKEGDLKSSSGKKVKSRKQAVAIGLSEARQEGDKVPPKKTSKGSKKSSKKSKKTAKASKKGSKKSAKKSSKKSASKKKGAAKSGKKKAR
jgi:hypothetical protein